MGQRRRRLVPAEPARLPPLPLARARRRQVVEGARRRRQSPDLNHPSVHHNDIIDPRGSLLIARTTGSNLGPVVLNSRSQAPTEVRFGDCEGVDCGLSAGDVTHSSAKAIPFQSGPCAALSALIYSTDRDRVWADTVWVRMWGAWRVGAGCLGLEDGFG